MPIRYIKIPAPITFVDPTKGEPLKSPSGEVEKPVTFDDVLMRLMAAPMWSESYHNIKAQNEIMQGMKNLVEGVLPLAEEDWHRLKQAVEFPKTLNFNPVLMYQLLPMLTAIMDAPIKDPRSSPKVAVAEVA
jgi:hypothetical protein